MDEELELVGKWWLPDTPEIKVSGRLNFKPGDNPKLDLEGLLNGADSILSISTKLMNPPIICVFMFFL